MDKKEYIRSPKEEIECNLCGSLNVKTIARRDKYCLPVKTVICQRCGLIFISPRMSSERYNSFYMNGEYRRLLKVFKGRDVSIEKTFSSGRKLGNFLAERLRSYIKEGLVVEVGSSAGGVLTGLKDKIPGIELLGIEPSEDETVFARNKGIRTNQTTLESMDDLTSAADTIVSVRSLNHFLNPRLFFEWSNRMLNHDGNLIVLVADFTTVCEKRGMLFPQLDHPYMFTTETLQSFLTSSGFEIIFNRIETIGSNSFILGVGRKNDNPVFKTQISQNEQARQIAMRLAHFKPPGIRYQIKHLRKIMKRKLKEKLR